MNELLWWHGIGWDTPLRDIGWSYVACIILGALVVHLVRKALNPDKK